MSAPLALVAGAGPGLGQALLSTLSHHGYKVIGLNRTALPNQTETLARDLRDATIVKQTVRDLVTRHGAPKLVVHNPAKLLIAPFEETANADFEAAWQAMVLSAINLARATLPDMVAAGGGCFIVSGATASLRGGKHFSAFASAKAALRALSQSLAREYGARGIHVAHVILDGILDTEQSRALHGMDPARMMKPDDVAKAYLSLAQQPASTWTHELDLRPMGEAF